jgi:hypothetical protein
MCTHTKLQRVFWSTHRIIPCWCTPSFCTLSGMRPGQSTTSCWNSMSIMGSVVSGAASESVPFRVPSDPVHHPVHHPAHAPFLKSLQIAENRKPARTRCLPEIRRLLWVHIRVQHRVSCLLLSQSFQPPHQYRFDLFFPPQLPVVSSVDRWENRA